MAPSTPNDLNSPNRPASGKSWKEPLPESRMPRTSGSAVRQSQPPSSSRSSYSGPECRAGSERRTNHDPYRGVDHRSGNERRSGYNQPDLADALSQRQTDLTAAQVDLDRRKADLAAERTAEYEGMNTSQRADLDERQRELDDEQASLDRQKALPPGSPLFSLTALRRDLIFKLEKAGFKGHSLDHDRRLMLEAAQHLRHLMGYNPDEPMIGPDSPYGPVVNEKPIGHSLPGDWPQDREGLGDSRNRDGEPYQRDRGTQSEGLYRRDGIGEDHPIRTVGAGTTGTGTTAAADQEARARAEQLYPPKSEPGNEPGTYRP